MLISGYHSLDKKKKKSPEDPRWVTAQVANHILGCIKGSVPRVILPL